MAWSIAASSKMMFAPFPPNSSVTFVSVPANVWAIWRPTGVEPVNASLLIPGCATRAAPVAPAPVMMLTTPSGKPACWQISANSNAVSEVVSAGFRTTVFPAAKAGAIFHASISSGKFHGTICPATPSDFGFGPNPAYSSLSAQPA